MLAYAGNLAHFIWAHLDNFERIAHIAAIAIGGLWALFFSGKIYKARLDLTVSCSTFREADNVFLNVAISVKNVGIGALQLDREKSTLDVYPLPDGTEFSPAPYAFILSEPRLTSIATVPPLPDDESILSAETVRNELLFLLPPNQTAVMVILVIVGNKDQQWDETKIIRVEPKDGLEKTS